MKNIILLLIITFNLATISRVKAQHLRVCTIDSLGNRSYKNYENLNRSANTISENTQAPISTPAPERLDTFMVNPPAAWLAKHPNSRLPAKNGSKDPSQQDPAKNQLVPTPSQQTDQSK